MAGDEVPRRQTAAPLAEILDDALRQITTNRPLPGHQDGFLFSGNRHDSVPRRLFLDRRLTPLERNAWQVFRLLLNEDGVTALPTYEQLRPWLASMPCHARASHETVARALILLRLTRWLSLVRRRRDADSGRILGNLYVLHDDPLTPFEGMQLDPDYLELVSQCLAHSSRAIQVVALHTLEEITDDPLLAGRTLPSRLQVLVERLRLRGNGLSLHDSEEGAASLLRNREQLTSESEAGLKPASDGLLRNPKTDSTVRSKNKVRTVPRAREIPGVQLPERFERLSAEQQSGAMMALQQVQAGLRQAVLDDWAQRCQSQAVRNPAGYLFGMIQRAIRGEFNAWGQPLVDREPRAGEKPFTTLSAVESSPPQQTHQASPKVARHYIDQLRGLLKE